MSKVLHLDPNQLPTPALLYQGKATHSRSFTSPEGEGNWEGAGPEEDDGLVRRYGYIVHYQFIVLYNTCSYITITFTDSSTWSKPDQLTVSLARRAHQPPGRLVDEDGLRGLPLAQRVVQGQGDVPTPVWELVHLEEPLHCRRQSEDGSRHRPTRAK